MPGAAEEEVAFARTPAWVEDGVEHFTHFSLNGEQYRLGQYVVVRSEKSGDRAEATDVALITDVALAWGEEEPLMVEGHWLYPPEEAAHARSLASWEGVAEELRADSRFLFFSFHKDRFPATAILRRTPVAVVPPECVPPPPSRGQGAREGAGPQWQYASFVYDVSAGPRRASLFAVTDKDFLEENQRVVDSALWRSCALWAPWPLRPGKRLRRTWEEARAATLGKGLEEAPGEGRQGAPARPLWEEHAGAALDSQAQGSGPGKRPRPDSRLRGEPHPGLRGEPHPGLRGEPHPALRGEPDLGLRGEPDPGLRLRGEPGPQPPSRRGLEAQAGEKGALHAGRQWRLASADSHEEVNGGWPSTRATRGDASPPGPSKEDGLSNLSSPSGMPTAPPPEHEERGALGLGEEAAAWDAPAAARDGLAAAQGQEPGPGEPRVGPGEPRVGPGEPRVGRPKRVAPPNVRTAQALQHLAEAQHGELRVLGPWPPPQMRSPPSDGAGAKARRDPLRVAVGKAVGQLRLPDRDDLGLSWIAALATAMVRSFGTRVEDAEEAEEAMPGSRGAGGSTPAPVHAPLRERAEGAGPGPAPVDEPGSSLERDAARAAEVAAEIEAEACSLPGAKHGALSLYEKKLRALQSNLRNNAHLSQRLLDGQVRAPALLNMSHDELRQA